jgi:hypothetical protein
MIVILEVTQILEGHCNWYYFKVSNNERVGEVQLNICNIGKIKNLYNKGMKPYVL